jgi:hypothetical protein
VPLATLVNNKAGEEVISRESQRLRGDSENLYHFTRSGQYLELQRYRGLVGVALLGVGRRDKVNLCTQSRLLLALKLLEPATGKKRRVCIISYMRKRTTPSNIVQCGRMQQAALYCTKCSKLWS